MAKTKISKKRDLSIDDLPIVHSSKKARIKPFNPSEQLAEKEFIAKALFEALCEGDEEAFIEIVNAYVEVISKTELVKRTKIPQSTLYHALSPHGNPTLKTIAKVMHAVA